MTTEQTALVTHSAGALMMDIAAIERIERIADMMASGKSTIPAHLRGSKGDCFAVCMQSMQWGMNPFSVAQKTFLVNGTLGYEAQLVAAVINASGTVKDRFSFEFYGPWEKVIGKFQIKKGDKGEYRVPGWALADEEGCGVRVFATIRGEAAPRVLDLLLAQARTRNSTLWADDPKQQLAYLAQKKWARLYAPDVILGVYTNDELADPAEKFMGQAEVVREASGTVIKGSAERVKELPPYPADDFASNLPAWAGIIQSGRQTPDQIIARVSTKGVLSEEQKQAIRDSAAIAPGLYEQIKAQLEKASDIDVLQVAADLIGEVEDSGLREELTAIYRKRQDELIG